MKHRFTLIFTSVFLNLGAAQQPAQDYTQQLPRELKSLIAGYMSSASTIEQATKNIKSLMRANKQWNQILNDQQVLGGLIKDLAQEFNEPILYAAAELGTKSSSEWVKKNVKSIQEELASVIKTPYEGKENQRYKTIKFLVKSGANIDETVYLDSAINQANLDLIKLLVSLGNNQINITRVMGVGFPPVRKTIVVSYVLDHALIKFGSARRRNNDAEAYQFAEIINYLLEKGAVPTADSKNELIRYGWFIQD